MSNPFSEIAESDPPDAELVEQAKKGDRTALERLVLRHQAWIYNIAIRMVFLPQDAEEVTQEVLIKVITKLNTFTGIIHRPFDDVRCARDWKFGISLSGVTASISKRLATALSTHSR